MARSAVFIRLIGQLEKRLSDLEIGAVLPSEQALADEFAVSKPTVRRALAELAANGLINKKNGVGSTVAGHMRVIPRELIFLCHDLVFFHKALESFSASAAAANFLPAIIPMQGDSVTRERIVSTSVARNPAGIVYYADTKAEEPAGCQTLRDSGIPLLWLIRAPENCRGGLLTFETEDGVAAIFRRFYSEGCRRFALYGDDSVNPLAARERIDAFRASMKRHRLTVREEWVSTGNEHVRSFLDQFRDPVRRPEAVICLNDVCAGNFYRHLLRAEIDPTGLKFSGFDNSPCAAFFPFPLLTVHPPMEEMGKVACDMLIRQIDNPGFGKVTRKLASRLIAVNQK